MIDAWLQARITPLLTALARPLQRLGATPDGLTLAGFGLGLLAALALAWQLHGLGLALLLLSRLLDGLDGALARLTRPTRRGAFLDIALDFVFYALIPVAFALADPAANALAAAVLLLAFVANGSSFLAYAALAPAAPPRPGPRKGMAYLGGLTEAGETLAVMVAMCLWPQHFALLAWGFAALCGLSWLARLRAGWRDLDGGAP